jgi:trimethylamine monooxygenase
MMGKIQLPKAEGQKEHFDEWRTRADILSSSESQIIYQGDYIMELIEATDYPNFDIDSTNQAFMEWGHNKLHDIMTFRDLPHTSVM